MSIAGASADLAVLYQSSFVRLLLRVRITEVVNDVVLSLEVIPMLLGLESPMVETHDFLVKVPCIPRLRVRVIPFVDASHL